MIKAVIDTNVLISGLISPKGSPAKIIDFWQKRKFVLVTSKVILKELEKVLNYSKIAKNYHLKKEKVSEYVKGFWAFSEVCSLAKKIAVVRNDPEDNKFIEAAVAARTDFIVSGDRHLLDLGEYQGIEILTAREFCLKLKSGATPSPSAKAPGNRLFNKR